MFSDLEKKSMIKRSELDEKKYMESLLKKAYTIGLIDTSNIFNIQNQLLELLRIKVKKYIGIENSSILADEAKIIMESNIYTINLYLKEMTPDEGILKLVNERIIDLYYSGMKILKRKVSLCKMLYHKVLSTMLQTENETYNSTLVDGINAFFRIYDFEYDARNIKITADYPLYNNLFGKLEGIEFIENYLKSLYYENVFCKMFSKAEIEEALYEYNENYSELVINIFTIIFVRAVCSKIIEKENEVLSWNCDNKKKLCEVLSGKSKKEIYDEVLTASRKIELKNVSLRKYIEHGIDNIQFDIYSARYS